MLSRRGCSSAGQERGAFNPGVEGSNPSAPTVFSGVPLGNVQRMDADHARTRLAEERDRLNGLRDELGVGGISRDGGEQESLAELSSYDQHQADVGTETFEREKDFSILEQIEAELADVERALERLDEGTYGTCEACGKQIGEERLEAMPASRFCLDDQSSAEQEARSTGQG
jgi:RNA polymerase-binding transcription factor DksA